MVNLGIIINDYVKINKDIEVVNFSLETDFKQIELACMYSYNHAIRYELNKTTAKIKDIMGSLINEKIMPENVLNYFIKNSSEFKPNLHPKDTLYLISGIANEVKKLTEKKEKIDFISKIEIKNKNQLEKLVKLTENIFEGYKIGKSPSNQLYVAYIK